MICIPSLNLLETERARKLLDIMRLARLHKVAEVQQHEHSHLYVILRGHAAET